LDLSRITSLSIQAADSPDPDQKFHDHARFLQEYFLATKKWIWSGNNIIASTGQY
jgi:hypothetical protein